MSSYKGSLILLNFLSLVTISGVIDEGELALGLLGAIIYIQQVDITYDSVNFDDPISTLSYFKKLYQSFLRCSDEEVDIIFNELTQLLKTGGNSESAEIEAQRIMRSAAEKIHGALQELNQGSISKTAAFVYAVFKEAVKALIDLVPDKGVDDIQFIRNHTKKDAGVLKDYEVLG